MDYMNQVQTLNEAVCISLCANSLKKGMNPSLLTPTIGKIINQTEFFNLSLACWNYHFTQNKILSLGPELSAPTSLFYNRQISVPNFWLNVFCRGHFVVTIKNERPLYGYLVEYVFASFLSFFFSPAQIWNWFHKSTHSKVHLSLLFIIY